MVRPGDIHELMQVRDSEGRSVGVVTGVGGEHFELEPEFVSAQPRDYLVDYADVASVRGHEVYLEPEARMEAENEDDGGALPPSHGNLNGEPTHG